MQRLLALLAVAALAGVAWWIAASLASGPANDTAATDEGLVVHVYVADRAGKAVTPAQIVRVYDEARAAVDAEGHVRLTNVTLRADEAPSAEAFALALKPLARHHALRRGFAPTATERADGSWEVRYALHAHGILRVHVEAVDLGACKAFLERDEPLRRWEPVGGHAVVRPGSVVDFRIYEGWDAPGWDGTLPLRLEGEPGPDGIVAVATQRVLVDAPSPGHTAQIRLVPEPVDPILGSVRVKEGPPPPTLRGTVLVHQVEADGSKVFVGSVPIDDEGSFTIRDAGARRYELVAGLDFAPGVITTEAKGGDFLELETPGRARWVTLEHPGFDATVGRVDVQVMSVEPRGDAGPLPMTVRALELARLEARHRRAFAQAEAAPGNGRHAGTDMMWFAPPLRPGKDRTLVAVAGAGTWQIHLGRAASHTHPPAAGQVEATVGSEASNVVAPIAMAESAHEAVPVRVSPEGWGEARSATVELLGMKRTVVRGGTSDVVFPYVPPPMTVEHDDGSTQAASHLLTVTWDDPQIAHAHIELRPVPAGKHREPVVVHAVRGGQLRLRMTGTGAGTLTATASVTLTRPGTDETVAHVDLVRRGVEPVWESTHAAPPGTYDWSVSLRTTLDEGDGRGPLAYWLLPSRFGEERPPVRIEAGETASLTYELPSK